MPEEITELSDVYSILNNNIYVSEIKGPVPEDEELEGYDRIFFFGEDIAVYLGISSSSNKYGYRLSLEADQINKSFSDTNKFLNSLEPKLQLLNSKYVHAPVQTMFGLLLGYNEQKNILYSLNNDFTIDQLDPSDLSPTVLSDYNRTREIPEWGDLKVITKEYIRDNHIGSIFVFTEGLITVHNTQTGQDSKSNQIIPFLYDSAYIDFLLDEYGLTYDNKDVIYMSDDLSEDIVSKVI